MEQPIKTEYTHFGKFVYYPDILPEEVKTIIPKINSCLSCSYVLKDSGTTFASIVELPSGKKIFIKRYNNKGFIYSIKYFFRKSRAEKALIKAMYLIHIGIPTPLPYAALTIRKYGLLSICYLILEAIENVIPTVEFFEMLSQNSHLRNHFLDKVAKLMVIMHKNNIIHNDLKLSNIYVKNKTSVAKKNIFQTQSISKLDDKLEYGIWDIDSLKLYSYTSKSHREKDIYRFIKSYCELSRRLTEKECNKKDLENAIINAYEKHFRNDF